HNITFDRRTHSQITTLSLHDALPMHEWPDGKNKALKGSIRTPSVPRPISFYALAGRDPEPNTTNRKKRQHGQGQAAVAVAQSILYKKRIFLNLLNRLVVLQNRVIYTKLLTHPSTSIY